MPALFQQVMANESQEHCDIGDVAVIAKKLGFNITGAEILRAQANRVLSLAPHELERLAAGGRVKAAANWGRAGKGYLDSAGFWILEFVRWGHTNPESEQQFVNFLSEIKKNKALHSKLLLAKSHTAVATIAREYGYEISGVNLLRYQAEQILKLDDEKGSVCVRTCLDPHPKICFIRISNKCLPPEPSLNKVAIQLEFVWDFHAIRNSITDKLLQKAL